jgi:6-pyruvoyltetrahydropterin/6-carboxytetrahydropterin synthase
VIRLTRVYRFSASHRLHAQALSDEANRETYGKCNNPFGHGHDYVLHVTVEGKLDEFGRVVDVGALDRLVRENVVAACDHRNLNTEVPEFAELTPTSENLAIVAGERLAAAWPAGWPGLARIRLEETKNNRFDYERN